MRLRSSGLNQMRGHQAHRLRPAASARAADSRCSQLRPDPLHIALEQARRVGVDAVDDHLDRRVALALEPCAKSAAQHDDARSPHAFRKAARPAWSVGDRCAGLEVDATARKAPAKICVSALGCSITRPIGTCLESSETAVAEQQQQEHRQHEGDRDAGWDRAGSAGTPCAASRADAGLVVGCSCQARAPRSSRDEGLLQVRFAAPPGVAARALISLGRAHGQDLAGGHDRPDGRSTRPLP